MNLRSYKKVWDVEKKVYSIQNVNLPAPINPKAGLFFLAAAAVIGILALLFPFVRKIHWSVLYLVLPFLLMKFFLKFKMDGKAPHKFMLGYLRHLHIRQVPEEAFKKTAGTGGKIKLDWDCTFRE